MPPLILTIVTRSSGRSSDRSTTSHDVRETVGTCAPVPVPSWSPLEEAQGLGGALDHLTANPAALVQQDNVAGDP